jgi:hypothetical protein
MVAAIPFAMVLMLGAAPAAAEPAPPPLQPVKICRKAEQSLGTHIRGGRKCRTAEEWEREDAARDRKPAGLQVTEGQNAGTQQAPH